MVMKQRGHTGQVPTSSPPAHHLPHPTPRRQTKVTRPGGSAVQPTQPTLQHWAIFTPLPLLPRGVSRPPHHYHPMPPLLWQLCGVAATLP